MIKLMAFFGILFGMTGVIFGAFGAHALKEKLSASALNAFEIGVRYQMYHALALLTIAWLFTQYPHSLIQYSGWLMIVGTIIFSGSLYVLALSGIRMIGAVTPVGGILLVISWFLLLVRLCLK